MNYTGTGDKYNESSSISNASRISQILEVMSCHQIKTGDGETHVAAASINSIVLDFVNPESMRRLEIVDATTTIIRTEMVLIMLQMTTGISRRSVIKNSSNVLAIRSIQGPEYMYTFASVERS